jgi:hypothetical protein
MTMPQIVSPSVPSYPTTITERYDALVASGTIERDPAQEEVVAVLDALAHRLKDINLLAAADLDRMDRSSGGFAAKLDLFEKRFGEWIGGDKKDAKQFDPPGGAVAQARNPFVAGYRKIDDYTIEITNPRPLGRDRAAPRE